ITGISRFSKVSLFSQANHLKDISMDTRYAAMMGYTQDEIGQYFAEHVQAITQERNAQGQSTSEEEVLAEIKAWYNGYRFSSEKIYVYNPFSTLNYFDEKKPKSYWYATGTPAFLLHEIKQRPQEAISLSQMLATQSRLSDISAVDTTPLPALMLQTGYLTIQDYNVALDAYQLDFPNKEVRDAFFGSMLAALGKLDSWVVHRLAKKLQASLSALELDTFVSIINTHLAKIPYHAYQHAKEGFYQALFLICLELSGIHAQGEVVTSQGRIDILCQLAGMFYIFELKVDQEAAMALEQALDQEYSQRCREQGKKIVVMGISFSSTTRDIAHWQGKLLDEHGVLLRKLAHAAKQ
ncbi:MAG: AAA family ATPase, partial [Bacteroidota bacterium]